MTTYDSIPYPSYSHPQTSPAHLSAIARVFGLSPVDPKSAKVLEIGCASGGNIIPLAARYPEAQFWGLDLSKAQISVAKQKAEKLALTNIKFVAASIVDHNFKRQKFDYIIAHGVYAWVPGNVQQRLLEVCGENLSKNGLAYISYNTLPGWNALKTIRDMMLYHSQNFSDPAQKVLEARNMLKFVSDNMKVQTGPYKETLDAEIKRLQNLSDSYLLHEYLEAVNEPCYFHEFAAKASDHGLTYLGDADLQSMFLGNHNEKVSSTLMQIEDNVRQEQYMDFISNRRFRMSLLVQNGLGINRVISEERLTGLRFTPNFKLEKPVDISQLGRVEEINLVNMQAADRKAKVKGRIFCAAVIEMLRAYPLRLSLDEIIEATMITLKDMDKETIRKEVTANIMRSIFNGMCSIIYDDVQPVLTPSEKPLAFGPALYESQLMEIVPNHYSEMVKLSDDQRLVLQYVNGENTIEQIGTALKRHIEKGEITLAANGEPIDSSAANYDDYIQKYVEDMIGVFANSSLLVA
ncbi:methyltransferase regulatory domain-containing protein [Terasakiella pusilla]|uniref:methyltransferase regulatory domain-containing protein n=1 Tax=Terasakiella pusilla TaxID=64973 RepID=UPI003AA7C724